MRPISGFFKAFNWGFDRLGHFYGLVTARVVRYAVIMLVVYVGIIAYGLNEFRKTPVGFIPQVDRGYVIVVVQLPPGASLARTDEVHRRAIDLALDTPGVEHGINFVGFSGATFTNAPNSGPIFLTLEPWEKRAGDPKKSAAAITAALFGKFAAIQEAFIIVVQPPPVSGIGNAGGFRMMVEDRGSQGPRALQAAAAELMARANQTPAAQPAE
jgi:multidrug efflux pump subunit AcrB